MLYQETDNTETSIQIGNSVANSSKQEGKAKKPNQELKRPLQTKQEQISEAKIQEELEEITRQSDPLNLFFLVNLTQGSRNSWIKLEKKGQWISWEKKQRMQVETFKQKCRRLQHEFNTDFMEKSSGHHRQDLRWTGSSHIQLKKRNHKRVWKKPIGSNSNDCKGIRQAEQEY